MTILKSCCSLLGMPGNGIHEFSNTGVRQVMKSLIRTPLGTHTILVYPNLKTIREIYTNYIMMNGLTESELFVILPYYETIESVKNNLMCDYASTKDYEEMKHDGSLVIQDSNTVLEQDIKSKTNFQPQPDTEIPNIIDFLNRVISHAKKINKKMISVWIDIGTFHNFGDGVESLVNYERVFPILFGKLPLKQFCLYHQKDFENRLNRHQQSEVLDEHQRRLMLVDNY